MTDIKDQYKPFPEAFEQKTRKTKAPWTIIDSDHEKGGARVDNTKRQMFIPLNEDGVPIARHEAGHVRWSPLKPPNTEFHPRFMQAVEDARVNLGLKKLRLDMDYSDELMKSIEELTTSKLESANPADPILRAIASLGTGAEGMMRDLIAEMEDPWATLGVFWMEKVKARLLNAARKAKKNVGPFKLTRQMAEEISKDIEYVWEEEQKKKQQAQQQGQGPIPGPMGGAGGPGGATPVPGGAQAAPGGQEAQEAPSSAQSTQEPTPTNQGRGESPPGEFEPAQNVITGQGPQDGGFNNGTPTSVPLPPMESPNAAPGPLFMETHSGDLVSQKSKVDMIRKFRAKALSLSEGERAARSLQKETERILRTRIKMHAKHRPGGRVTACPMVITRPPLTVAQRRVVQGRARLPKASDEGTMIRRPDRWCIDRAIFARTKRGAGCTVLVDGSGSMDISSSQIEDIVIAAGGNAKVAMYAGDGEVAELRIIAEGERRVKKERLVSPGTYNSCDLTALEWCGDQPGPRIWISDGYVNGIKGRTDSPYLEMCLKVQKTHQITRFQYIDKAINHLVNLGLSL